VLKLWTLSFRGSGRSKYAYEMLHLIDNLTHVWPVPLRKIVMQNWLVNPTGKPNAWVEVDLMQEHLNFWIKTIYKVHGSNASWEWLTLISPRVNILRQPVTQVNSELGTRQGVKHTSPDLERDITHLMESLREHGVYPVEPGRVLETVKPSVPTVVALGCTQLSGPLSDFNCQLFRLQERCQMKPVERGSILTRMVRHTLGVKCRPKTLGLYLSKELPERPMAHLLRYLPTCHLV
ncbi:hypothetical protein BD414DRAFT_426749, partial [Trametes punicea]